MTTENIKEIGIDELGRLYIVPNKETFEFIYRYAAGVNWDGTKNCLYSPTPTPEMKYDGWF